MRPRRFDYQSQGWTPNSALRINSRTEEEIRILELRAGSTNSNEGVDTGEWERITDPQPDDNRSIGLRPMMLSPPTSITLTLGTGQTAESSYYRFVRTGRIDVFGSEGTPERAQGVVSVETGLYTVERFVTDGVSRPGASEGSTTKYDLESSALGTGPYSRRDDNSRRNSADGILDRLAGYSHFLNKIASGPTLTGHLGARQRCPRPPPHTHRRPRRTRPHAAQWPAWVQIPNPDVGVD